MLEGTLTYNQVIYISMHPVIYQTSFLTLDQVVLAWLRFGIEEDLDNWTAQDMVEAWRNITSTLVTNLQEAYPRRDLSHHIRTITTAEAKCT